MIRISGRFQSGWNYGPICPAATAPVPSSRPGGARRSCFEVAALLVVAVERRGIARSDNAWGLGGDAELAEEPAHEPGLVDHAHDAQAAAALRARENVQIGP